jgi:formylmethanofuran dehydrogenase subunit B
MSIEKFIKASIQDEDEGPSTPSPQVESFTDFDAEFHSGLCAGCSCLCDDISYYFKEGRLTRTLNLCEVGWKRLCTVFAEDRVLPPSPSLLAESLKRAARLLQTHPPVLVLGADSADEAAILASGDLARTFHGISLPWAFPGIRRFYDRARRFGWATGLLDEVRDRAESVIFWRADPLITHHRHLSRYSLFARGRMTERGNLDRNLAAVASDKTVLEPLCQQFFQLSTDQDVTLIEALAQPGGGGGFDHRDLPALSRALQGSSYVALFVDPEKVTDEALDALFRWSAKLNTEGRKRMVILPLWDAGSNLEGFIRVSLEKNATPWGGAFAEDSAAAPLEETSWEDLAKTVGSIVLISSGADPSPGVLLPECLSEKPRVVIDPFKRISAQNDQVVIPAALPGLESDGIFFRADGLPFAVDSVEGWKDHGYPTVRKVLTDLMNEGQ